jgi:hypothetical protein
LKCLISKTSRTVTYSSSKSGCKDCIIRKINTIEVLKMRAVVNERCCSKVLLNYLILMVQSRIEKSILQPFLVCILIQNLSPNAFLKNECGCFLRQISTSSLQKMNVPPSLFHNAEQLISVAIAGSLIENWRVFCRVVNQANLVVTVEWS